MKTKVDKKNILKQMFDVRPISKAGFLDSKKIFSAGRVLDVKKIEEQKKDRGKRFLLDLGLCENSKRKISIEKRNKPIEEVYRTEKDLADIESQKFKFFYESFNSKSSKNKTFNNKSSDMLIKEGDGGIIREEDKKNKNTAEYPIFVKKSKIKENAAGIEGLKKEIKRSLNKAGEAASEAIAPLVFHWRKSLAVFAVISCIITSSVGAFAFYQKGAEKSSSLKELGAQGFGSILDAKEDIENKNFEKALADFRKAFEIFEKAEKKIGVAENFLAKIPNLLGNSLPSSGIRLIKTGKHISEAGEKLSQAFLPLFAIDEKFNVLPALSSANNLIEKSLNDVKLANSEAKFIDENSLPENIRGQVKLLKEGLPEIQNILGKSKNYLNKILSILGSDNPKKYLLIFQNNSELRATGGFIGSFAVVDVYKGIISNLKVDGIYNPAGQLLEQIIPPFPLKKAADKWNIFDANYFADFPQSAKKISWFYEKTGGATVDGIIAITPNAIEDLLKILGPVSLEQYGASISSENFVDAAQFEVEENYEKSENKPKQIIADLAEILLDRIMESKQEDWQSILNVLKTNLNEKHILVYFFNQSWQRMAEEEGWAGEVLESAHDYLQIVHTNINGYKTDRKIQEKAIHEASINEAGEIIDTIILTKKHNGGATGYDWYDRQNGDFIRIFVPLGSELISAEGFSKEEIYSKNKDFSGFIKDSDVEKIEKNMERDLKTGVFKFQESKKTVFAGWMYTDPGQTSMIKISYRLPFKMLSDDDNYGILYQKQSGHHGLQLTTRVLYSGEKIEEKTRNLIYDESFVAPIQN